MTGINRILRLTWEIAEKPTDDKIKLQAFAQLNEGYKFKMDLTTNGIVVTDAIKYVQNQMNHLNETGKKLLKEEERESEESKESAEPDYDEEEELEEGQEKDTGELEEEEEKTTNDVF
jgi:hypothetical protein